MADMATATAAPVDIHLGGKTFRMSPLTNQDLGELQQYLVSRIMQEARASLPPDATDKQRQITEEAALRYTQGLSWMSGDGARKMADVTGMTRILWQGLKHNHPDITVEEVHTLLLDPATLEDARRDIDRLNMPASPKKARRRTPKKRSKRKAKPRKSKSR